MICRRASLVLSRNAVGFNRFANLDVSEADEIVWRFPDVRFQAIANSRRLDGALRGKARVTHSRRSKLWWVIRDGVCPMVLCPNGAAVSRVY